MSLNSLTNSLYWAWLKNGRGSKIHVLHLGSLSKIFWYIWGTNGTQCNYKIKGNFFFVKVYKRPQTNYVKFYNNNQGFFHFVLWHVCFQDPDDRIRNLESRVTFLNDENFNLKYQLEICRKMLDRISEGGSK